MSSSPSAGPPATVTPPPTATTAPTLPSATPAPSTTPPATPAATRVASPGPPSPPGAAPTTPQGPVEPSTNVATGADAAASDDQSSELEAAADWHAFVPTDAADHLATMDKAARESGCGVPWQLLAAIARVESDFGRNMATSSAGAIGYGQFLPSSWQAFGSEGNIYDYRDALPAMARYLCQAGLARDPRAALFAYNHADWYVDLVLGLAVRYDRMAPGAPTPDVLSVGPAEQASIPMRYAAGRDTRVQARARTLESGVRWLGVPWRGRAPGQAVSAEALVSTTLASVRAAFGVGTEPPSIAAGTIEADRLKSVADTAWDAGLIARTEPEWTPGGLRQHLLRGEPVVVFVASQNLPGHPPGERVEDQPLVLIGATPDGFIYNDPTFSSSLGYGLEMTETDLVKQWSGAVQARQALAFGARPRPPARQAHLRELDPPAVVARAWPTATPVPPPTAVATSELAAEAEPVADASPAMMDAIAVEADAGAGSDYSWLILIGAGLFVASVFTIRRLRARESP